MSIALKDDTVTSSVRSYAKMVFNLLLLPKGLFVLTDIADVTDITDLVNVA